MKLIIFVVIFYIIPLTIIKIGNKYLRKRGHRTIFDNEFWISFTLCCIPLLNFGMTLWVLLDIFDYLEMEDKFESFKKRITKWMS